MNTLLFASALALFPVSSGDDLLSSDRTFVSPEAQASLAEKDGEALCLARSKREKHRHICLTRDEWRQAVSLAEKDAREEASIKRREQMIAQARNSRLLGY